MSFVDLQRAGKVSAVLACLACPEGPNCDQLAVAPAQLGKENVIESSKLARTWSNLVIEYIPAFAKFL